MRSRERGAGYVFSLVLVLLCSVILSSSSAFTASPVFGPETYTRTTGEPITETDTFTVTDPGAPHWLTIINGDQGEHQVTSGWVWINGVLEAHPSDFSPHVGRIKKRITLTATTTISVRLAGAPDSFLSLEIGKATGCLPMQFVGPWTFTRQTGPPRTETRNFSIEHPNNHYLLRILNGDENGNHRVSSGWVWVNNVQIAQPSDFNQQVETIEREVTLQQQNELKVKLASTPGAFITVSVVGDSVVAPTIEILAPTDGEINRTGTIDVSGNISADVVTVRVNGGSAAILDATTFLATGVPLVPGPNPIEATAFDACGRSATDTISVTYEPLPALAVQITSPQEGTTLSTPLASVSGTVSDDTALVTVNGVSATVVNGGFTATDVPLTPGSNSLTATAVRGVETATDSVSVNLLTLSIITPTDGQEFADQPITVTGKVSLADATVFVNGVTATVTGTGFTVTNVPLSAGANQLIAQATYGGVTASSPRVNVEFNQPSGIDVEITDPQEGATLSTTPISVSGTIAGANSVVKVNGVYATVQNGTFTAEDVWLGKGANTLTATASNQEGTDTDSVSVVLQVEYTPLPEGSFGAQYEHLVPPDTTVASYDSERFSLINGLVKGLNGDPMQDVAVTINLHPEYGTAKTLSDGTFSLPVEGGGTLTVVYRKAGFLTVHRSVQVGWNDIGTAEPIEMIPEDSRATTVAFDGNPETVITHQSTPVTDQCGTRSCTLVFTGDNLAYEADPEGNLMQPLPRVTVRATEYPTADSMPALLPPACAFTYAVELRADGVEKVKFDKPVVIWVDNFLGFDVGQIVPVGFYDRHRAVWVPSENGKVVKLLDTDADGTADALDANGDGLPDDLDEDGTYTGEVRGLNDPAKYPPNAAFWRIVLDHFTPVAPSMPVGSVDGLVPADLPGKPTQDLSGVFRKEIHLPDTNLGLHYASARVPGYACVIRVPVTGSIIPPGLTGADVFITIPAADRRLEQRFYVAPLPPNQTAEFVWDGLDSDGRPLPLLGEEVEILVRYLCFGSYSSPQVTSDLEAFGRPGQGSVPSPARTQAIVERKQNLTLALNVGTVVSGWTFSPHHRIEKQHPSLLLKGDGTILQCPPLISTAAGTGFDGYLSVPRGVAVDPAGNVYIADPPRNVVKKITKDIAFVANPARFAGTGLTGYNGDDIAADQARLSNPYDVATSSDGSVYIADTGNCRVRKVTISPKLATKITTVAGNGTSGYSAGSGLATDAQVVPYGLATDAYGNLYIACRDHHVVRKVDTAGTISTVAGTGTSGYSGDGGPAAAAVLNSPGDVSCDDAGNLFIADTGNHVIRKIGLDGVISRVAGTGAPGFSGDGGPAQAAALDSPVFITVDAEGNAYVSDEDNCRVRKVLATGNIETMTGTGEPGFFGDGGPAAQALINAPSGIAVSAGGAIYFSDTANRRVRKIALPGPPPSGAASRDFDVIEETGIRYVMSPSGLHKKTVDMSTGDTLYEFVYSAANQLVGIKDRAGTTTSIIRDTTSGLITSVISPGGVTTGVTIEGSTVWAKRLTAVSFCDGTGVGFEYGSSGLMTKTIPAYAGASSAEHMYDVRGRFSHDVVDGQVSEEAEKGQIWVQLPAGVFQIGERKRVTTWWAAQNCERVTLFMSSTPGGGELMWDTVSAAIEQNGRDVFGMGGSTHWFELYKGNKEKLLSMGSVTCPVPQAAGTISARPQTVYVCDDQSLGATTLAWSAEGCTRVQIYASTAEGERKVLDQAIPAATAANASGALTVKDLEPNASYEFILYQGDKQQLPLAQVTVPCIVYVGAPDSDTDTLPDCWELNWFGDLTHQATDDDDGDGVTNEIEYRLGSDPGVQDLPRPGIHYEYDAIGRIKKVYRIPAALPILPE